MNKIPNSFPDKQSGAVLVIALVFLLILTTLAVTNMREVALESRITSNMVDQRHLYNAAEAGLKDAEYRTIGSLVPVLQYDHSILPAALSPLDTENTCSSAVNSPCLLADDYTYSQDFDTAGKSKPYSPDASTSFNESIEWYALRADGGEAQGETDNPEYGNMMMGKGTFNYEVNSRATRENGEVRLRATVFRTYLGSRN